MLTIVGKSPIFTDQVETFLNGPLLVEIHSFGGLKIQFRLPEEASFMELYHSTEAGLRSAEEQKQRSNSTCKVWGQLGNSAQVFCVPWVLLLCNFGFFALSVLLLSPQLTGRWLSFSMAAACLISCSAPWMALQFCHEMKA